MFQYLSSISIYITSQPPNDQKKHGDSSGLVYVLVYARHGRELMGWKSPVCEPC